MARHKGPGPGRGGKREGAGRPPLPDAFTRSAKLGPVRVTPQEYADVQEALRLYSTTLSDAVRQLPGLLYLRHTRHR